MKPSPHTHLKIKIAVSGAAETRHCGPNVLALTKELGAEVARQGGVLITGATTGAPYWAAIGAKEAEGFVIGLSPATSEAEHVKKYRLPVDYHDMIIYTGFGYSGRNLFLTRSADGVIISCGRMGTINEFTIAFEDDKPIGVLTNSGWMTDDIVKKIIEEAHRGSGKVVWDENPQRLVAKVIELIKREKLIKV